MIISTIAFKKTSPICGWWSPTLRKQMKPLNSRRLRVWFITCLWRLSVSLSWVAQLWCFPCMLLSFWSLGSGLIWSLVVNSLLGIWLLCLATPWPFSCRSWCLWWSLSCCRFPWPLSSGSMKSWRPKRRLTLQKMGSKKSLMDPSTLRMWPLLIPMKMATRPMSYKGLIFPFVQGKWLVSWEEQDQGNQAWFSWFLVSMMLSLVGWQ